MHRYLYALTNTIHMQWNFALEEICISSLVVTLKYYPRSTQSYFYTMVQVLETGLKKQIMQM